MRVIECSLCGLLLQAGDDEELVQVAMRHMSADHEEAQIGEDQVRGMVERNAYTADAITRSNAVSSGPTSAGLSLCMAL